MSSPIGHTLAGYIIHVIRADRIGNRRSFSKDRFNVLKPAGYLYLLVFITIANAPDLDFLPGLILGYPNLYHHGISHSLGAALLFSGGCALLHKSEKFRLFSVSFGTAMILYCSHLLLDILSQDARPPLGIPLLWPLTDTAFYLPLLPPVTHSLLDHATIGQFLADAISLHNLGVILKECMLAGGLLAGFILLKRVVLSFGFQINPAQPTNEKFEDRK